MRTRQPSPKSQWGWHVHGRPGSRGVRVGAPPAFVTVWPPPESGCDLTVGTSFTYFNFENNLPFLNYLFLLKDLLFKVQHIVTQNGSSFLGLLPAVSYNVPLRRLIRSNPSSVGVSCSSWRSQARHSHREAGAAPSWPCRLRCHPMLRSVASPQWEPRQWLHAAH